MFRNALISVADKEGIVEFVKALEQMGTRIVSTGGTANLLEKNGIHVVKVSEQTGFPEVMDGRVKTLHPKIHMALLARDYIETDMTELKAQELEPFDLVVGNLYAFEEALKKGLEDRDLQEFIDIGGPSFLRAAAKNFSRITTVCNPQDYSFILKKKSLSLEDRKQLASKVFYHVSAYDSMVARALNTKKNMESELSSLEFFSVGGGLKSQLRYGENPQQEATWYRSFADSGLHDAEIIQGKALSYNNLLDLDAAISTLNEFEAPCCVAIKHNNPCGVGLSNHLTLAVSKGLSADPVSVFGGVIALNRRVDKVVAEQLSHIFLECIIAPDYTAEALDIFSSKKNLRVLKSEKVTNWKNAYDIRKILGGFLVQESDVVQPTYQDTWEIVGKSPDQEVKEEMVFAMKVCAHLKSNAIAICSKGQTLGLGMGQVNRVDAVQQAILRMQNHHPRAGLKVLASDAFFPFADSVELAAKAGIEWIIQPGGSVKDQDVFAAVERFNIGMVLTGRRHFKH